MLKLVQYNDIMLKTAIPLYSDNFKFQSPELDAIYINKLADAMLEVMLDSGGIGLAANQVGLNLRLIVASHDRNIYKFLNPEIVEASSKEVFIEEGCLSFPHLRIKIKRPENITIRHMAVNGTYTTLYCDGMLARIVQHELDHLNGITFDTKVSRLKLKEIKQKLRIPYDLY